MPSHLMLADAVAQIAQAGNLDLKQAQSELLAELAAGHRVGEGLPARLDRDFEFTANGEPTSYDYERISEGYWLDAISSDRVAIYFDYNSLFAGLLGYMHIRVLPSDTGVRISRVKLPKKADLETAIAETISELKIREEIPRKQFCDRVRAKLGVKAAVRGYGDKTIERAYRKLERGADK